MRRKRESILLPGLLSKIAPKLGAKLLIEPEWGIVGQITFKNGKKRYFRYNTLDLNPVGASDVAKDKDYAAFFMRKMGYPTVRGKTFYSNTWARAIGSDRNTTAAARYAAKIGYPVIVKPNSGSQGAGVFLVHTRAELLRALREIHRSDRIALLQKQIAGRDYRIVVLDNSVISAYERIPLSVIGDGRSTTAQLLRKKQRQFICAGRDTRLKLDDPRISAKLSKQNISLRSVPTRGERIFLLDNANLSTGGDAIDVSNAVHPAFKKLAIRLTKDMGLRLCGVDIIVKGDIRQKPKKYWIIEVNAAPGLDHYAQTGAAQKRIVENLYLKILKHLAH